MIRSRLLEQSVLGAFLAALSLAATASSGAACDKLHASGSGPPGSPSQASCPGGGAQPVGEPDAGLSLNPGPADPSRDSGAAHSRVTRGLEGGPCSPEPHAASAVPKRSHPHAAADRPHHPSAPRLEHPAGSADETPPAPAPARAHPSRPVPGPPAAHAIPSPHRMPDPNVL